MEKANIAPFYVGQKVVYITGINMPKDSVHTVTDIKQSTCGCWIIEINGTKLNQVNRNCMCVNCFKRKAIDYNGWHATSFRQLQQQNFPLIKLSEIRIKETEKVEPILIGEN